MDLAATSNLFRTLADGTRVRLLALLSREELTVAELAQVTQLAQPRVSTHLSKLKELDLVRDRRAGVSAYYRFNDEADGSLLALWQTLSQTTNDPLLGDDQNRLAAVLARRSDETGWAESVAGDMERHYSPGRTWEALARALTRLIDLGDVLDIASGDGITAELLAPRARSIVCVDAGPRVVEAASRRLRGVANARVQLGDMHALDFPDASFDLVLLLHALTYSDRPSRVLSEAARVLRPNGRVLVLTLARHAHHGAVAPFDHKNLGFDARQLKQLASAAGLAGAVVESGCRERRAPHFEVLSLLAHKSP